MGNSRSWWRQATTGAIVAAVTTTSGALTSSASAAPHVEQAGSGPIITAAGQDVGMTRVFNPYLETSAMALMGNDVLNGPASGFIYEPLAQVNYVRADDVVPWLAKSWTWSKDYKTLTWHLRSGVKWSDGVPFSSADVVFSYDLMKRVPALNLAGITFSSVTAPNADTVVVHFASPNSQNFDQIAGLVIVPQHIWAQIKDPAQFADPDPIGTGPFVLSSFSPQGYLLTKNPDYWQRGKPYIGGIRFVNFSSNETEANAVVEGQIDWAADYIPDASTTYLNRSPDNHYWVPEAGSDGLEPNLDTWPLSDLQVRRAISLGSNREAIAAARNSPPATNVTGLPVPSFSSIVAPQYKHDNFRYDPTEAKELLEKDGFKMGSDGYFQKNGKELTFSVSFPGAYTDIAASMSVFVPEMKNIGIKVTLDTVPANEINTLTGLGKFESTSGYPVAYVPTGWSFYSEMMDPQFYKPIGVNDPTYEDIERFKDPTALKLFQEYPSASQSEQNKIIAQLEGIWASQLPVITLYYWGDYAEWTTKQLTGWATPTDPYFMPSPNEVVALRLRPVS